MKDKPCNRFVEMAGLCKWVFFFFAEFVDLFPEKKWIKFFFILTNQDYTIKNILEI